MYAPMQILRTPISDPIWSPLRDYGQRLRHNSSSHCTRILRRYVLHSCRWSTGRCLGRTWWTSFCHSVFVAKWITSNWPDVTRVARRTQLVVVRLDQYRKCTVLCPVPAEVSCLQLKSHPVPTTECLLT